MGIMYAMKCDLCGEVQVKENADEIRGTTYNENGKMNFACNKCKSLMKAAFEVGKSGLKNPLSQVAGLIEQRDKAQREKEEALATLEGTNPFAGLAVGDPKAILRTGPQPGQSIPLVNPRSQTRSLPAKHKPPGIEHETSSRRKGHGKKA